MGMNMEYGVWNMEYEYGIRNYCYRRIIFSVIMHNVGLKNKYSVKHRKDFLFGLG